MFSIDRSLKKILSHHTLLGRERPYKLGAERLSSKVCVSTANTPAPVFSPKIDVTSRNYITQMPLEQAWRMRAKQAYPGDMSPKRTEETMSLIRQGMVHGRIDPIPATPIDLKEGRLQEGKHRLIVARSLGMTHYPVEVIEVK
jgi:hypothetical protein